MRYVVLKSYIRDEEGRHPPGVSLLLKDTEADRLVLLGCADYESTASGCLSKPVQDDAEEPVVIPKQPKGLYSKTLEELQNTAVELNISVPEKAKRKDLINLIKDCTR